MSLIIIETIFTGDLMKTAIAVAAACSILLPAAPALAERPNRQDLAELYSLRDVDSYLDSEVRVPPAAPSAALKLGKRLAKALGPVGTRYRNNLGGNTFRWGDANTNATLSIIKKPSAQDRLTALIRSARRTGARVDADGNVVVIKKPTSTTALRAVSGKALLTATVAGRQENKARRAVATLNRDWMFVQPNSRAFDRRHDAAYAAWTLVAAYNGYPELPGGKPRSDFPTPPQDVTDVLRVLPTAGQRSSFELLIQSQPNIVGGESGCVTLSGHQTVHVIFDTATGAGSRITAMGYGSCPGSDIDPNADPTALLPSSTIGQQPELSKTDIRITKRLQERLGVKKLDLVLMPTINLAAFVEASTSTSPPARMFSGVSYTWTGSRFAGSRVVLMKKTATSYVRDSVRLTRSTIEMLNGLGADSEFTFELTRRGKARIMRTKLLSDSTSVLLPIDKHRLIETTVKGKNGPQRALAAARAVKQTSRNIEAGQYRFMQRYAAEGIGWQIVGTINGVLAAGGEYLVPDWGTFDPEPLWKPLNLDMPDLPNFYVDITSTPGGCIQITPKSGYDSKTAYLLVDASPGGHSRVREFAYGRCPSTAP